MDLKRTKGFSVVEGLLVLITMGILAAILVPSTLQTQARHRYKSIVIQLGQIEAAKQEAAFANNWNDNRSVSMHHDLVPKYLPSEPEGPLGGHYSPNTVGTEATYQGKTAEQWKAACEKDSTSAGCGL